MVRKRPKSAIKNSRPREDMAGDSSSSPRIFVFCQFEYNMSNYIYIYTVYSIYII